VSFFLSFEGIDGCGKTTQLTLLQARLESVGHSVVATREPGGTALAEAIRDYLLHSTQPLDGATELLLFGAARAQHVAEVIRPSLKRGDVVLSDRFADSSLAYQGGGLGLGMDFIRQMNVFATNGMQPDITVLLDVDPLVGLQRRATQRGEDRIEERGLEFQQRVRGAFLDIARAEPERVVILDGSALAKVVHNRIIRALQERGLWK
jgi:dTMP kinase